MFSIVLAAAAGALFVCAALAPRHRFTLTGFGLLCLMLALLVTPTA